ncbi:MAG TPA: flavoprotein [Streptosporangiaceae bacterium]
MKDNALTIIACGSSAATNLPAYLTGLAGAVDLELRVLLTPSAGRFIQPQVVAWYADEVIGSDDPALNPAELAGRSIGIVVLPATANMVAAAALGLAAGPAQTTLLAAPDPALFFPSMNPSMWAKGTTQRHVAALRAEGHTVVEPLEQRMYEIWRRDFTTGPALPPPHVATETIIEWLEKRLNAEP